MKFSGCNLNSKIVRISFLVLYLFLIHVTQTLGQAETAAAAPEAAAAEEAVDADEGTTTTTEDPADAEPGVEPGGDDAAEAGTEPAAEPVGDDAAEAATEPGAEPIGGEPGAEPIGGEPGAEPVGDEPAAEPVGDEPAAEPVGDDPAAEPVGDEPAAEPVGDEPAAEPVGEETGAEPVGDDAAEAATEPGAEGGAEPGAEGGEEGGTAVDAKGLATRLADPEGGEDESGGGGACPEGDGEKFHRLRKTRFYILQNFARASWVTWAGAKKKCEEHGLKLAKIDTIETDVLVARELEKFIREKEWIDNWYWLDAKFDRKLKTYVWQDTMTPLNYSNFHYRAPRPKGYGDFYDNDGNYLDKPEFEYCLAQSIPLEFPNSVDPPQVVQHGFHTSWWERECKSAKKGNVLCESPDPQCEEQQPVSPYTSRTGGYYEDMWPLSNRKYVVYWGAKSFNDAKALCAANKMKVYSPGSDDKCLPQNLKNWMMRATSYSFWTDVKYKVSTKEFLYPDGTAVPESSYKIVAPSAQDPTQSVVADPAEPAGEASTREGVFPLAGPDPSAAPGEDPPGSAEEVVPGASGEAVPAASEETTPAASGETSDTTSSPGASSEYDTVDHKQPAAAATSVGARKPVAARITKVSQSSASSSSSKSSSSSSSQVIAGTGLKVPIPPIKDFADPDALPAPAASRIAAPKVAPAAAGIAVAPAGVRVKGRHQKKSRHRQKRSVAAEHIETCTSVTWNFEMTPLNLNFCDCDYNSLVLTPENCNNPIGVICQHPDVEERPCTTEYFGMDQLPGKTYTDVLKAPKYNEFVPFNDDKEGKILRSVYKQSGAYGVCPEGRRVTKLENFWGDVSAFEASNYPYDYLAPYWMRPRLNENDPAKHICYLSRLKYDKEEGTLEREVIEEDCAKWTGFILCKQVDKGMGSTDPEDEKSARGRLDGGLNSLDSDPKEAIEPL